MADATREVGFRITADSSDAVDAYQDTAKASKAAGKAVEVFGKRSNKALMAIRKVGGKVAGMFKGIGSALTSLKGLVAGFVAFMAARGLVSFFRESIRLAQVQEQAIVELGATLAQVGATDVEGASQRLREFASGLQAITVFGDEVILSVATLGLRMGVAQEDIEKTTEAAVQLSAGLKIDLRSAMQLVAKASQGNTDALSRYGLAVDKSLPKTEKFAAVLEMVNRQFGGAAQAQARTFAGAIAQLGNTWGDLREQIGGVITANKTVRAAIIQLNKFLGVQSEQLKKNQQGASDLVSRGLVQVLDAMGKIVKIGAFVVNAFQGVVLAGKGLGVALSIAFAGIVKSVEFLLLPLDQVLEALKTLGAIDTNPISDGLGGIAEQAMAAADALADDIVKGADGMVEVKLAAEEAARDIGNFKNSVLRTAETLDDEYTPAANRAAKSTRELGEGWDFAGESGAKLFEGMGAIGDGADKATESIRNLNLAAAEVSGLRLVDAVRGFANAQREAGIEAEKLGDKLANNEITQKEFNKSVQELEDSLHKQAVTVASEWVGAFAEAGNALGQMIAAVLLGQKKLEQALAEIGVAMLQNIVMVVEQAVLAFAVQAAAAQLAAHAFLPFIGIAVGAAAAATVFGLVKALIGSIPTAADGGEVVGGIPGKDSVLVNAMPGERILTVRENRDLKRFVKSLVGPGAGGVDSSSAPILGMAQGGTVPQMAMAGAGGFGAPAINVQFNSVVPSDMTQRKRAFRQVERELVRNRARQPFSGSR